MDALAELLTHLERDGGVPLAWVAAHAPNGDLGPSWSTCGDGEVLLHLAAAVTDRSALVLAACACVRTVLDRVPSFEHRPRLAIECAEAWARDEELEMPVQAAFSAAWNAAHEIGDAYPAGESAAMAAASAAEIILAGNLRDRCVSAAQVGRMVAASAAGLTFFGSAWPNARREGLSSLVAACVHVAELVRAQLPCPTLEQLRTAYHQRLAPDRH